MIMEMIMAMILNWNIRSGGGTRVPAIAGAINALNPDIVVLTEFRIGPKGTLLLSKLNEQGFSHHASTSAATNENTVHVASKIPFLASRTFSQLGINSHRLLEVDFPGFSLIGFYFPQKDAKRPVFEHLLKLSRERINTPALWIGDLNTGKHRIDEAGATFYCAEYLSLLEQAGHIDAWRDCHGTEREYTWFSNAGNGFRIDHAFVTPPLRSKVTNVYYSHDERLNGISDHSAMLVEIE
jgi:exodeoxyribonuclease III